MDEDVVLTQVGSFQESFAQYYEQEVFLLPFISSVLCNNPGLMTLQGTNTWIIYAGQIASSVQSHVWSEFSNTLMHAYDIPWVIVIDPGPVDEVHLRILVDIVQAYSLKILILLTHSHPDHCANVLELAKYTGAIINSGTLLKVEQAAGLGYAPDLSYSPADMVYFHSILSPGDSLLTSAGRLYCLSTPGHTDDSVSYFLDPAEKLSAESLVESAELSINQFGNTAMATMSIASDVEEQSELKFSKNSGCAEYMVLFSGDTLLGEGSTVLLSENALQKYYDSLHKIIALGPNVLLAPGHGNICLSAQARAQEMYDYRVQRLQALQDFLKEAEIAVHEAVPAQLVQILYRNTLPELWPMAELSIAAQLEYLRRQIN